MDMSSGGPTIPTGTYERVNQKVSCVESYYFPTQIFFSKNFYKCINTVHYFHIKFVITSIGVAKQSWGFVAFASFFVLHGLKKQHSTRTLPSYIIKFCVAFLYDFHELTYFWYFLVCLLTLILFFFYQLY